MHLMQPISSHINSIPKDQHNLLHNMATPILQPKKKSVTSDNTVLAEETVVIPEAYKHAYHQYKTEQADKENKEKASLVNQKLANMNIDVGSSVFNAVHNDCSYLQKENYLPELNVKSTSHRKEKMPSENETHSTQSVIDTGIHDSFSKGVSLYNKYRIP